MIIKINDQRLRNTFLRAYATLPLEAQDVIRHRLREITDQSAPLDNNEYAAAFPYGGNYDIKLYNLLKPLPDDELLGILAHELAHVYRGHVGGQNNEFDRLEMEVDANRQAAVWGMPNKRNAKARYEEFKQQAKLTFPDRLEVHLK